MWVARLQVCIGTICMQWLRRPKEGVKSPGTETDGKWNKVGLKGRQLVSRAVRLGEQLMVEHLLSMPKALGQERCTRF